ncbi:MAG: phospholipid carrier-dependent glycosyltransferase [Velocimicrobium sp.]
MRAGQTIKMKQKKSYYRAIHYMILGVIFRIILAGISKGHASDLSCFISWADRIVQTGCHNFYSSDVFTDYPPGYMYILWILGKFRQIITLPWDSFANLILMKMPAIICDTLTALFIWKIAKRKSEKIGLYAVLLFTFNPAIFINSAVWGQVDSIFTLCVILVCYLVSEHKLPLSYFIFAIGVLIKPQTLVFTPVLLFGVWNAVFKEGKFQLKEFSKQSLWACLALISLLMGMLPFGIINVITQYIKTMASYPYASVNAYNIWNLFGQNWVSQDVTFLGIAYSKIGSIAILITVIFAAYICMKGKKETERYMIAGAVIIGGMFLFSVRMHERYLYPILAILLLSYVYTQKKEWLISYLLFSLGHFINVFHVLYYPLNEVGKFNKVAFLDSIFLIGSFGYLCYQIFKSFGLKQKTYQNSREKGSARTEICNEKIKQLKRKDYVIILILSLVYACIAFYDLGQNRACESYYTFSNADESVVLDMGKSTYISKISYYLGNLENRGFRLEMAQDVEGPYHFVTEWQMISVFCWGSVDINDKGQYLRITSTSERAKVEELVFYDFDGNQITPVGSTPNAVQLYDEQSVYDGRSSFRNSTYFDEIYHARTAYEYLTGEYSYENTHPPLGKTLIALGIKLFGMNPFGWRFMGTLFGVLMIPVIYVFAFKLVSSTFLSTIISILFTFDFMHFVQTRIATIDVFVTFFIMIMYLFMFLYIRENKNYWLALSGICMGFGVACKWTGAYAGIGLAIIFFLHLIQNYKNASNKNKGIHNAIQTCLLCVLFFVIIPVTIYTLSYIPFRDGTDRGIIARMLNNQVSMYHYHTTVNATHPYSSWWYQWPTMYRPIWYYSGYISDTVKEGISAFGNPLVWWTGIVAFFYCAYQMIKERDKTARFLCIAYLAQYVPWFFVTRITFIYHYFPSVAFVVLMIGYGMKKLWEQDQVLWKRRFIIYAGLTILLFAAFYPVLSGMPVSVSYVSNFLRWFDSWVLI